MDFSVILPTWNVQAHLENTLQAVRAGAPKKTEILISDASSCDGTQALARKLADRLLLTCVPNRGLQLDCAVRASSGKHLFILHADTLPPKNWGEVLLRFWRDPPPQTVACVFHLEYDPPHWRTRLISGGIRLRTRALGLPYGDQGLSLSRETYERCGGYFHIPLLEDVDILRRIRRLGRIALLPQAVRSSSRRYRHRGPFRNTLLNYWFLCRYLMGESPERLWRRYYDQTSP
ncbi:MAG: TIGR04283 family arsenosugar biosynthesis glycosyltransferase [Elusimicrobia bacterium]|nr:TIGR04283 family arsenosugar biosynthesis glycosyltransferase [Elusimicrobiota bacterium]